MCTECHEKHYVWQGPRKFTKYCPSIQDEWEPSSGQTEKENARPGERSWGVPVWKQAMYEEVAEWGSSSEPQNAEYDLSDSSQSS